MKATDPIEVKKLFNSIAPSYDRLNDLFSLGLHRVWKKQLISWVDPQSGGYWIDVCCGTGDMAIELARRLGPGGAVLGFDAAEEPLAKAVKRAQKISLLNISWMKADALATGLDSNTFDGAVMAYGLRNLSDPLAGLIELRRLLRKGASAGILDFNKTNEGTITGRFQQFYLRKLVVPMAAKLGMRKEYAYLEASIKNFPSGKEQEELALEAGFSKALHRPLAANQMGALLLKA